MAMTSEAAISSTSNITDRGVSSFIKRLCFSLSPLKMQKKPKPTVAGVHCASSKSKEFDCVFRYFDENGDGKISPGELRDCMRISGWEELSLEAAEAVVQSADSDGDGLLGFDDFVSLVDAQGEEERVRSLKEAFEVYEAKAGEGCITAKSLRRALRRLGESRSVEECREMIRRYDENGDGVISFEEFRNMMMV